MPTRRWGEEKLVNTITAGSQFHSDVAALAGGGFVVVWEDESAGPDAAIRGQRYDALGNAVGAEMLIAPSIATNDLFLPKVAGLANGNFYVSWTQFTSVENYIFGKVYNPNGGLVRSQPVVFAANHVANGDLAPLGGGAAAAWISPTGGGDIYLRLFTPAGAGGNVITVSDYPNGNEGEVVVAASPNGATVAVLWTSGESGDTSVIGRLYAAGGQLITTFSAIIGNAGYVGSPAVSWLNNGQLVVAWRGQNDFIGGHPGEILLRSFNFNGTTVTPTPFTNIVLANATTLGEQTLPVMTALPNGGFAVAWEDFSKVGVDSSGSAIRLQTFDASGGKIGGEIVINTTTTGMQLQPSIAALRDGRIVVSWTDNSSGNNDIKMQIVDPRDGLVTGTSGNDRLYGHDLVNDEISGGAGNDSLFGLRGDDALYGGEGNDSLNGQNGNDVCYGGTGNDTIDGGRHDDEIYGGAGTDLIYVSPGEDTVSGGPGIDTLSFAALATTTGVTINLGAGSFVGPDGKSQALTSIENVSGTAFADRITGNSAANTLSGGSGKDTITGGGGADRMAGNPGNDVFDFNSVAESGPAATQRDTITDFNAGTTATVVDRLDLSTIDANISVAGNQAFAFIGAAGFSGPGQVRAFQSGGDTFVQVSNDGDTAPEMVIVLDVPVTLTAADFVL